MYDLSQSVIMPREDFIELQTAAWTPQTASQRVAGTVQTIIIFTALSAAFTGAAWGWAKAMDHLDEKNFQRKTRLRTSPSATK